jgi:hypothetical protein
MKTRSILTISLLTVSMLIGCAPAATPVPVQLPLPATEPPVEPSSLPTATDAPATRTPTQVPQVLATSRGSQLEATDPKTYVRASGGLQLVEFFAFW